MTRADFEKLPNRPERMWLKEMHEMTDNLRTMFDRVDAKEAPEVDVEKMMEFVVEDASKSLRDTVFWDDLNGLQFSYWACMEEMENWYSLARSEVCNEDEREGRAEAMLRTTVLTAWLHAINRRVEELGGKME